MKALGRISFVVERGEFVCIVGPSGCGKTTLLRTIAGLQTATSGVVTLSGRRVTQPPEGMALVFQDYRSSLMPWLTVRKNLLLPLRHKKLDKAERSRLIEESAASVGLGEFLDHYPWQLSGGMQQRVAIARAIAYRPDVMIMDEPFASVDAQTRADLEDLVLQVRQRYGMTILLVTHDVDEAVYLADRVVVLSSRPSEVVEEVAIAFPGQRDQIATKELPEFGHLRAHVFRSVKGVSQGTPTHAGDLPAAS
ncbi:ABC transporter ATP-binding protein [Herbiconiux ginsengi]|uniref:ABC transporter ATP-binding protein n=1 Tax=Herbiconiux ginsengi TaxID=381665 RepID=UPI002ADE10D4|nr:ABC transporter ATP-binding protein [Herbiconiux ginsengi]